MKNYYSIELGNNGVYAKECYEDNFIGVDFSRSLSLVMDLDYTDLLKNEYPDLINYNSSSFMQLIHKKIIHKECPNSYHSGNIFALILLLIKSIKIGDVILSRKGENYILGEVKSDYYFQPGGILPHRRDVIWFPETIEKKTIDKIFSKGWATDISKYAVEIESLINDIKKNKDTIVNSAIENSQSFKLGKNLENFLIQNWSMTEFGKTYKIYALQYPTDREPIEILAISKDQKTWLVVRMKMKWLDERVVEQIKYDMDFVEKEFAKENQTIKGIIIGLDDDLRIKRAISVSDNIDFYRYQVNFKLFKS